MCKSVFNFLGFSTSVGNKRNIQLFFFIYNTVSMTSNAFEQKNDDLDMNIAVCRDILFP